jgi:hypothetical protein
MTDQRDVGGCEWLAFGYRFATLEDLQFSVLEGAWSGEYGGAWVVGSRRDIKLLSEFGVDSGYSIGKPIGVFSFNLRKYLRAAFKVRPRGYLVYPQTLHHGESGELVHGVGLLRFTQVQVGLGREAKVSYRVSTPSGETLEFDPDRWYSEIDWVSNHFVGH